MPYSIRFTPRALRDFAAFDRATQQRLQRRIDRLAQNPYPAGGKKLQAEEPFYPEFRSCDARWEETPHSARYSRHPLPKGEGRRRRLFSALSLGERVVRCRRFHQPERAG